MQYSKLGLTIIASLCVAIFQPFLLSFPNSFSLPTAQAQSIDSRKAEAERLIIEAAAIVETSDRIEDAIPPLQKALAIYREIGERLFEAGTLSELGNIYYALENYTQALEYYQQALVIRPDLEAQVLEMFASTYYYLGDYPNAIDYSQKDLAVQRKNGFRYGEAKALGNLGNLYYFLGDTETAIDYYQQSLAIETEVELPDGLALSNLGAAFFKIGNYKQAQQSLLSAIELSEAKLKDLDDAYRVERAEWQIRPYYLLQQTLIAQNKVQTALEISERGRSRAFVELLAKRLSLQSTLQAAIQFPTIKQIQQIAQAQNATIVQYSIIYNDLISRGVKQPQQPNDRVIFIPQRELFLVPFPALQDASGKYLIEKHTITTAPAIQVLELTRQQRQRVSGKDALVVGNPTMPSVPLEPGQPPQPLSSLPGAEIEAKAIAQLLGTQALIGNQATKAAIVQQMPQAGIIHLATHGLLDDFGTGVPGALALAPPEGRFALAASGNDDGLLTAGEILNLKLNAELVVLSACDTGRGQITGDGVIGLSRSLISAGVPSVIVSLWSVPDAPTASLMVEFYRNLQQTPDKAQALRQAMLITMKQHPNPKDWAAFTLIGEPN